MMVNEQQQVAAMNLLRGKVFNPGHILNMITKTFGVNDMKNLRRSSQQFNEIVLCNTPWLSEQRIIVTQTNAMEIAEFPTRRLWTNLRIELAAGQRIMGRKEFQALRFIWDQVEDLQAINKSVSSLDEDVELKENMRNFSSSLARDLLFHAGKLTRLVVSADILCGSTVNDLNNLDKGPWRKLNHFEIKVIPDTQGNIWWTYRQCDYSSFVHGHSTASLRYMEFLSILNWENLETFKLDTVEDITLSVVSCNLLKNVRILDLNGFPSSNCEGPLWARMKRFEMCLLNELTTTVVSSKSQIHSDLRTFLEKQPNLTSIHLRVKYLKEELFGANESRIGAYPWKKLRIEFRKGEDVPLSFGLFAQLKLESFAFEGSDAYHSNAEGPEPSVEEVIDLLPSTMTMTHLTLSLCSTMYGANRLRLIEECERKSHVKFPNLQECLINLIPDCQICHVVQIYFRRQNDFVMNE